MARQIGFYDQLKQDHSGVKQILQDMLSSKESQKAKRRELVAKLRKELLAHAHAEERMFYSELEQHGESKEIAFEAEEEHHAAETLLRELESTDSSDEHWLAKATVLNEMVCHHIEEEEGEMFEQAHKVLAGDQEAELLQRFQTEKQQEMRRL